MSGMERLLTGKTAIVTGVGRRIGIGAAIAHALARAGADVVITIYRLYEMEHYGHADNMDDLLEELRAYGVRASRVELDLSHPEAAQILFAAVREDYGMVDILVNNAAVSVDSDIEALSGDLIDGHLAVNVRGMMLLCQAFVRQWQKPAGGRIINMTSGQGYSPMPGNLAYAASKGAVDAFTTSFAAEVMQRGITVNAIDPGATDTGWMSDDLKAQLEAQSPTGRVGMPDDAARLVRFLASDDAAWITGQIIRSRGGM